MLGRTPRPEMPEKTINGSIRKLTVRTALMRCSVLIRRSDRDYGISDRIERDESFEKYAKIVHIVTSIALPLAKRLDEPFFEALSWYWLGRATAREGQWEESRAHFQRAADLRAKEKAENADNDIQDLYEWLTKARYRTDDAGSSRQRRSSREQHDWKDEQMAGPSVAESSPARLPKNWDVNAEIKYISSQKMLSSRLRSVLKALPERSTDEAGAERSPAGSIHDARSSELEHPPEFSSTFHSAETSPTQGSAVSKGTSRSLWERRNVKMVPINTKSHRDGLRTNFPVTSSAASENGDSEEVDIMLEQPPFVDNAGSSQSGEMGAVLGLPAEPKAKLYTREGITKNIKKHHLHGKDKVCSRAEQFLEEHSVSVTLSEPNSPIPEKVDQLNGVDKARQFSDNMQVHVKAKPESERSGSGLEDLVYFKDAQPELHKEGGIMSAIDSVEVVMGERKVDLATDNTSRVESIPLHTPDPTSSDRHEKDTRHLRATRKRSNTIGPTRPDLSANHHLKPFPEQQGRNVWGKRIKVPQKNGIPKSHRCQPCPNHYAPPHTPGFHNLHTPNFCNTTGCH
ncbi:hypothetical protein BDV96DRAFT_684697 [Lophiotrema nucula]|uniref:Uncharacterized protein n=1 Tax=Lophiotrema nucula TaxID=690887 RepID=A0A6A5ZJ84_9PLEO|nr:hypothetical protein BDV96DRAFT_684697 [Lophiotrema nucula]